MMIFNFVLLAVVSYVIMGLLTTLIKHKQIIKFSEFAAPYLAKEIDPQELMQLEASGVSMERIAKIAGYTFCFFKWPAALFLDFNDWSEAVKVKHNVKR